jgi:hypothetical protein
MAESNLHRQLWNLQKPNSTLRQTYPTAEDYVLEMKRRKNNPMWAQENADERLKQLQGQANSHARPASRRLVGGKKSRRMRRMRNRTKRVAKR